MSDYMAQPFLMKTKEYNTGLFGTYLIKTYIISV